MKRKLKTKLAMALAIHLHHAIQFDEFWWKDLNREIRTKCLKQAAEIIKTMDSF